MNILSQDSKILVNYNNVASLCIQKKYMSYSHPDTWWEIWAIYPAVSEDVIYDVLAKFDDEQECMRVFKRMTSLICQEMVDFVQLSSI